MGRFGRLDVQSGFVSVDPEPDVLVGDVDLQDLDVIPGGTGAEQRSLDRLAGLDDFNQCLRAAVKFEQPGDEYFRRRPPRRRRIGFVRV